jgi:hypothetical protein
LEHTQNLKGWGDGGAYHSVFSHSSKREVLLPFQNGMFLCDMHTVGYNLIPFTNFNFKIEIEQIMKQSVLHRNGRAKDVFKNSRGHLTYVTRAAGFASLFYRLHVEDRAREGESGMPKRGGDWGDGTSKSKYYQSPFLSLHTAYAGNHNRILF